MFLQHQNWITICLKVMHSSNWWWRVFCPIQLYYLFDTINKQKRKKRKNTTWTWGQYTKQGLRSGKVIRNEWTDKIGTIKLIVIDQFFKKFNLNTYLTFVNNLKEIIQFSGSTKYFRVKQSLYAMLVENVSLSVSKTEKSIWLCHWVAKL